MSKIYNLLFLMNLNFVFINNFLLLAQVQTTLNDFFLPGSQPNQSGSFNDLPNNCGCHNNYDLAVEPMFNWRGSMMSQSQRDPLYLAALTIANQDADFSGDLCIRCHSPRGWLSGRSTPTNGSALTADDREGIYCEFCHRAIKPTQIAVNPYPNNTEYTISTYPLDQTYLSTLTLPDNLPDSSANGMYLIASDDTRRGPYTESDAQATHNEIYSPFHRDARMCGTCHDVSNPVYTRELDDSYVLNTLDLPSPDFNPYEMFPVERTFSEWLMSEYNSTGVYAPQFGGNKDTVFTCQDCHFKDVTGKGCDKNRAPIRDDLGLHDMTGGNTFIPLLLPIIFPGEVDVEALDSAISRATYMLQNAAELEFIGESIRLQDDSIQIKVKITNNTGHKLPSGYPEGRRIWLNIQAYDIEDSLIFESGAYDYSTGILTYDNQVKIYEIKPGLTEATAIALGKTAGPSFHFVINDTIYKDNRIPPRGFTNVNFAAIQSPPVSYNYDDGQYWDETIYTLPPSTASYIARLYYQTVSKEYVEFLRDNNTTDNRGITMYNLWNANGKSAPVIMKLINGIVSTTTFQLSVNVNDGWNMVSVPGTNPDGTGVDIWWENRDPIANVFKYAGVYQSVEDATPGVGYWVKHLGAQTYNTGDEWPSEGIQIVIHNPIPGVTGWNMIGGYENNAATSSITTSPPGLVNGPVYGFNGGYTTAATIDPGYGYWINLSGDGDIILPNAFAKETEQIEWFKKDWGRIVMIDLAGNKQTLYAVTGKVNLNQYEMPPLPPQGKFDIRFSSGRIAEDINSSVQRIEMRGVTYPLIVRVENMVIRLVDEMGTKLNENLKDGEEIIIRDSQIRKLMISGELLPTAYVLEQNYPNPFNPNTIIKYALPKTQDVKLVIYNALGEKVKTLISKIQEAGYYIIIWDSTNDYGSKVGSGIYIYSLRAGDYYTVKKMMLVK